MNLPPGVRSEVVSTDRLRMRYLDSGPEDGIPVVMIHGNLSTGRFWEQVMAGAQIKRGHSEQISLRFKPGGGPNSLFHAAFAWLGCADKWDKLVLQIVRELSSERHRT